MVEGDANLRGQRAALVRAMGHEVVECGDAEAVLRELAAGSSVIVLLEWMPPGSSAAELCRRIRETPDGGSPCIVALAERGDAEELDQMLVQGADDFQVGPATELQLRARLRVAELRVQQRAARAVIEERLGLMQKAVDTTQVGVTISDLDHRIVYANAAEAEMHGYAVKDLIGQDARSFAPRSQWSPDKTPEQVAEFKRWKRETVNVRRDGSVFPVQITSDVVRAAGQPLRIVTRCEDISERKTAGLALRESEERYALAAEGSNDGVWDWNLATGEVYRSGRWKRILGYADGEFGARPSDWLDRVHPSDLERLQGALDSHLAGQTPRFECSYRIKHRNGSYRWVLSRGLAIRGDDGKPLRIAGSLSDLSARAVHDELTGLPSRVLFDELLRLAEARQRRDPGRILAVLLIELDRFRIVSEGLGNARADRMLADIARRIEGRVHAARSLTPTDAVLARAGGDAFLLLLEGISNPDDSIRVAERIQAALETPFEIDGDEVFASASVGIVLGTSESSLADPVRDAAIALKRARHLGEKRIQVFGREMQEDVSARFHTESDIRRAVERKQLRAVYQPILELGTGRLAGCEALVRWQHPDRGLVSPGEFLPVAEELGVIVEIDHWMLEEACCQLLAWERGAERRTAFAINVNLSSRHFAQGDVVAEVRGALARSKCPGNRLKLEITESSLMTDPDSTARALAQLRELGARICVDDFGTGYSSLGYLHRFPIDVIKIDRAFVMEIGGKGREGAIVAAIVSLSRHLGMEVVAEGIETQEQLAALRAIGCTYGQGFLFSKPVSGEEAQGWFGSEPGWSASFA